MARFLSPLKVLVTVENVNSKPQYSFFLVERSDRAAAFGPPEEAPLGNCSAPRLCLRPDLLAGYGGWEEGLYVMRRKTVQESFAPREFLATAAVCGPVPGAPWVTPAEDVAFYCSPGPDQQPSMTGKIWMIGF
jgi:hypothetical protein